MTRFEEYIIKIRLDQSWIMTRYGFTGIYVHKIWLTGQWTKKIEKFLIY